MKIVSFYIILFCALIFSSCNQQKHKIPVEKPASILSNYMSFWRYWNDHVKLSEDYIAYNENNIQIDRKTFLKKLISGGDLPLRLKSIDSPAYKLYRLSDSTNPGISSTISQYGNYFYQYYLMEGKPLPDFNFVDLNGHIYNEETCKGKIVVLNCWFIGCQACETEMPELNQLVHSYKHRKDILFVSLAINSPNQLKDFLSKTEFDYAVVPNMKRYMEDKVNIFMYPTDIIINKKGLVANVMNAADELKIALKKEASK